jgi:hypothetical protein
MSAREDTVIKELQRSAQQLSDVGDHAGAARLLHKVVEIADKAVEISSQRMAATEARMEAAEAAEAEKPKLPHGEHGEFVAALLGQGGGSDA